MEFENKNIEKKKAFVDENGYFHCPCGAKHNRGSVQPKVGGVNPIYRCLKCGNYYGGRYVLVELR